MRNPSERKLVSICFLDLLHQLAIQARANPGEIKFLKAIVRSVEEIKKVDGVVGGNERPSRVAGQAEWEKMICRIFDVRNLDEEKLTEFLYYYPPPRSVTKSDYETLLFVFEKVSVLIENLNPELVSEYVDAIHAIPEALKGKIDRKLFYRSYVFPFYKKWPKFFSAGELKSLKEYSKSSNN